MTGLEAKEYGLVDEVIEKNPHRDIEKEISS